MNSVMFDKKKEEKAARKQKRIDEVTRVIALIVAFISVFVFFIKLLFL